MRSGELYAADNSNTTYSYVAHFGASICRDMVLSLSSRLIAQSSYGHDARSCSVSFQLDRQQADAVAQRYGLVRQDRTPQGSQVASAFSAARSVYRVGDPVEIRVRLSIPAGAPALQHQVGGRNRGPRNNQFSFVVHRDGQQLQAIEAWDFGGLSTMATISPGGAPFEVTEQLQRWADLSQPGTYRVECRYETLVAPPGSNPYSQNHRGAAWDAAFTGTVTFVVR